LDREKRGKIGWKKDARERGYSTKAEAGTKKRGTYFVKKRQGSPASSLLERREGEKKTFT